MQQRNRRIRQVLSATLGVSLAIASGAHALSSALTRNSPELAIALWPSNGLARERLAYRSFVEGVRKRLSGLGSDDDPRRSAGADLDNQLTVGGSEMGRFATASSAAAFRALRDEPLLPKAHAIVALSQNNPALQEQIVSLASRLNRRDLALQGLVLQSRVEIGDYPGTMETLDQILRVHPQRQAEFFPVLTNALKQPITIANFRELLAKPLPWRDAFLMHAANDPIAARNLAVIRENIEPDNSDFDKSLIANLTRNGDVEAAARIYLKVLKQGSSVSGFSWTSDYPPFDWNFANEPGLRGQLSKDGRDLEFAVDPGNGGVLASRLMRLPQKAFTLTIHHELADDASANDLKLTLGCFGEGDAFFEESFARTEGRFDINQRPGCDYVLLSVSGRAWTGSAPLNGRLIDVVVTGS